MAVPSSIDDLSPTAASNGPDGSVDLPSSYDDYLRAHASFIRRIRDGSEFPPLLSSVSGADTITATAPAAFTAYAAGQSFGLVAAGNNTGAVTLNVNSLGAKDVTRRGATALVANDIKSGEVVLVVYDGTRFQLIGRDDQVGAASNTAAGIVELATSAETITGTSTTLAVTPAGSAAAIADSVAPATLVPTISDDLGSDVAVTSGTSHQILGVPSWALHVEVEFLSISGDGADQWGLQVGNNATGFATTGYSGSVSGGTSALAFSNGFAAMQSTSAAAVWNGRVVLSRARAADTTWTYSGWFGRSDSAAIVHIGVGQVTISALDRVRIAMLGGSSVFDGSGSIRAKAGI